MQSLEERLEQRLDRLERLAVLAAKNVFSTDDLALYLGVSRKTVYNKVGSIPHYVGGDGRIYFRRADVEAWQCGNGE